MCRSRTVDDGSWVKAAVLLAPVGGDPGALWEVTHGRRLYVDYLELREISTLIFPICSTPFMSPPPQGGVEEQTDVRERAAVYSQLPAAVAPSSRCAVGCLAPPPPPRCNCRQEERKKEGKGSEVLG